MSTTARTGHEMAVELCRAIGNVIKGKDEAIELAVVALLAEGHLLIEDVPGVGKTTLAHTMARALGCTFHRLQFTSDLLPSDVLGVAIYDPGAREFEFKPGPIFANIVLADEINRTTPKTQSALLEAMNENQVTIDHATHHLPHPFMVLATQNPVEHHGTYPLPESQLDRFLMRIEIGYPDPSSEKEILRRSANGQHAPAVGPVLTPAEVVRLQEDSRNVYVGEPLVDYMIDIVNQTRRRPEIELGVSPRGAAALFRAVQAKAFLDGREYARPDDVKKLVGPVFGHRLVLARGGVEPRTHARLVLEELMERIPAPA